MADTYNPLDIINAIKRDVGHIANVVALGIARIAEQDMNYAHKEIMKSYYEGYTPVDHYYFQYYDKYGELHAGITHGYRRTYNLGENSRIPVGIKESPKNHSYKAILHVGPDEMEDYKHHLTGNVFPAKAVFDMVWNQGIRGLPPGYRGHIGEVAIDTDLYQIHLDGYPHSAMEKFIHEWGNTRGKEIADNITDYVNID